MSALRNGRSVPRDTARQTWRDRLDRFVDSRLTVAAFCRRESVSVPSFYYWKRQLDGDRVAAADDAPRLLPVCLTSDPTPVELVLPDGLVLRLNPGCDLEFVRTLAQTLGRSEC
jgi:transposase